jgi:hypothetical protein
MRKLAADLSISGKDRILKSSNALLTIQVVSLKPVLYTWTKEFSVSFKHVPSLTILHSIAEDQFSFSKEKILALRTVLSIKLLHLIMEVPSYLTKEQVLY